MDCYRCHTPLPDDSCFCLSCGADVSDPSGAGGATAAMDAAAAAQLLRLVKQEVGSEFELQQELGRGGMAIVYLATEVHLGRKVAIKVLPPELTFGSGAIERFKREARTAATLDHPHIIPIYRITPGGKLFWYAMKFLEGRSLADVIKEKHHLPLSETMSVLEQVASALDYAHARNVIHRDMKPANVVLDAQNRAIVTDFGIAKQLAAGSFTASGSVIGTPYYMSPEQCSGSTTLTGAADQYSVAVMTYQILSGQVPFEGEGAIEILTKHCTQPPPPLDVLRPGLPHHVYQAVEKALAKKAEDRFPTVTAFVEGLKRSSQVATIALPRRPSLWQRVKTAPAPPVQRRRVWLTVLGLSAVAGGTVGGTWLWLARDKTLSGSRPAAPDTLAAGRPTSQPAVLPPVDSAQTGARPTQPEPELTATTPPPPTTGRLTLSGVPAGASVLVDGQRRTGTTFDLAGGRHIVRIDAAGLEPMTDTVSVNAGQPITLRYASRPLASRPAPAAARQPPTQAQPAPAEPAAAQAAVLVIRTTGGWAKISVDGVFRREGTAHRDSLPPGTHTLRFERDGYVTIDTTVTLRAGETRVMTVPIRPAGRDGE